MRFAPLTPDPAVRCFRQSELLCRRSSLKYKTLSNKLSIMVRVNAYFMRNIVLKSHDFVFANVVDEAKQAISDVKVKY